jgi:hypothetical protein
VNSETEFTLNHLILFQIDSGLSYFAFSSYAWHWHMWTTDNDFWGLKVQTTLISVLPWWVFLGVDPLTDSPTD